MLLKESDQWGSRESSAYERNRPLFIQYLNPEVLSCYGWKSISQNKILENSLAATRLAVLATDSKLVFPVSYLYEVPILRSFLSAIEPLVSQGVVSYISPYREISDYGESKTEEYRTDAFNPYKSTKIDIQGSDLIWTPRSGRATAGEITEEWQASLTTAGDLHFLIVDSSKRWGVKTRNAERVFLDVPQRLEGRAFVARFVRDILRRPLGPGGINRIELFVSGVYLRSYLKDTGAAMLYDFDFGDLSCGLTRLDGDIQQRLYSARRLERVLQWIGIKEFVQGMATWANLILLRVLPEFSLIMSATFGAPNLHNLNAAIVRAKGRSSINVARSVSQARRNVEAVANELASNNT